MKKLYFLILILLIPNFLISCSTLLTKPVEIQGFYMGTVITEKIYGKSAKNVAEQVMTRIQEIEKIMTINAPGGDINNLNEKAGLSSVNVSAETLFVLDKAKEYGELSKGSFDVTIGPLVKAWGVFTENPRVPSQTEINQLIGLLDYKKLIINKDEKTAMLSDKNQIVDLGGIAKGYAGDEAIKVCKENGIQSAFINLGGNVVVLGNKPDGTPWNIAVRNPRGDPNSYIGILKVKDKAIVSSGDYERYFEDNNKRYHHIIDPKSGYPADSGLISTTIVADSSTDADALSTATFVLGLDEGIKFVESLQGIEAIFITSDKKVYTTSGLKDIFIFDDESKEFDYVEKR